MDKTSLNQEIDNELVLHEKEASISYIIDRIYLGNYAAALNKDLLKEKGITHILNCGKDLKSMYPEDFKYLYIPLWDSEYTKVGKHLDTSNAFINEGNEDQCNIFVHCGAGMSRSATLVLAYLIMKKKMTYAEAITLTKEKRPQICPNPGFIKQMEQLSFELHHKF